MSEENGKAVGSDTIRKAVCISADPDQRAFLEGYGRDVLPRLRKHLREKAKSLA
jgi:hypothetical protein